MQVLDIDIDEILALDEELAAALADDNDEEASQKNENEVQNDVLPAFASLSTITTSSIDVSRNKSPDEYVSDQEEETTMTASPVTQEALFELLRKCRF